MADFASMIYGTAQNVAQSQGEGLAKGIESGIGLAMKHEEVQQKRQQLEQQKQELEQTKITKLYDFVGNAHKYDSASDRNNYLKNALGYRNMMGISPDQVPDSSILALSSDENMGRMYTIKNMVASGELPMKDGLDLLTNPAKADALAKVIPTPPELMGKSADLSEAQKEFLNRQSQERAAQMRVNATAGQNTTSNTNELRKELTAHPVSKDTFVLKSSYDRIKNSFETKNPSAAGDMSGIFAYMKMLDPNSTVREGEYANAQNAGGLDDKIISAYNKAKDGRLLDTKQRKDFMNQAESIYTSQKIKQENLNQQYANIAKNSGIKPEQIFAGTDLNKPSAKSVTFKGKSFSEDKLKQFLKDHPNDPDAPAVKKLLGGK